MMPADKFDVCLHVLQNHRQHMLDLIDSHRNFRKRIAELEMQHQADKVEIERLLSINKENEVLSSELRNHVVTLQSQLVQSQSQYSECMKFAQSAKSSQSRVSEIIGEVRLSKLHFVSLFLISIHEYCIM